jgi:hypothetical protein
MPTAKRTKFQIRSDAAKQRWVRDDRKEAYWRKHILAWQRSGLSKRAYCKANNLSDSSFNAWNREIGIRDREKCPTANAAALVPPSKNPFQQIRLVEDEPEQPSQIEPSSPSDTERGDTLDILVPGGAVIRVTEGCRIEYITQLFSSLKA